MNGILLINKPYGCTSRDIVNRVGKILNTKKVGHTGTLDPIATGVLTICIGEATKLVEILTSDEKEYIASVTLGINTDTLDITGNILETKDTNISKDKINNVLSNMIGNYDQEVPIYSAVKINGKKLYEYARNSIDISLPKRNVEIKKLELISEPIYDDGKTTFKIKCLVSKGTYIRSLVRDIASNLNTIGVMSELNRTKQGMFLIDDAYNIEDIENGNFKLINMLDCLSEYKIVIANDFLKNKIKNGSIINNLYNEDIVVFKDNHDNLLAIYKTYEKDKSKMKPWKMFKFE